MDILPYVCVKEVDELRFYAELFAIQKRLTQNVFKSELPNFILIFTYISLNCLYGALNKKIQRIWQAIGLVFAPQIVNVSEIGFLGRLLQ